MYILQPQKVALTDRKKSHKVLMMMEATRLIWAGAGDHGGFCEKVQSNYV